MRKKIKKLHLYVALIFFLPLILQGLTGMALVFEEEISNFSLVKNQENKNYSIAEILDVSSKAGYSKVSLIKFNENSIKVRFDKNAEIVLDSSSLKIVEDKKLQKGFFYFVKKFHTNLLLDQQWSRNTVGIFGVALLFLSISGIIIWWPKNLDKLRASIKFSFRDIGYRFHKTVHKSVGIWIFIILTTSSLSGVYLVFKKPFTPIKVVAEERKILAIDEILKVAAASVDNGYLAIISFPVKPEQPYRLGFYKENSVKDSSFLVSVFINPYSGEIIEIRDPSKSSLGNRILAAQHAIHTGKIFGIVGKILVFLAGITPLIFSITGIYMWWMKKKGKL
jgi:uncharacterized iron-regulated membrane protein